MTENEMIENLTQVWTNMTMDKDRAAYSKMLVLLDNMYHYLWNDLQIEYPIDDIMAAEGDFNF